MKKILFVCHGNICRSPMAEFVMKDLVKKAGLASQFHIESAATSRGEIGNPVYPPARRKLAEHGISCGGHAARQLTNRDYEEYDLLIGMDRANLRDMHRICGGDFAGKLHLLMDYTDHPRDVADPWYTEDFKATWQDVLAGCQGLLHELMEGNENADEFQRIPQYRRVDQTGDPHGAVPCDGQRQSGIAGSLPFHRRGHQRAQDMGQQIC